jgi:hypothetical protein
MRHVYLKILRRILARASARRWNELVRQKLEKVPAIIGGIPVSEVGAGARVISTPDMHSHESLKGISRGVAGLELILVSLDGSTNYGRRPKEAGSGRVEESLPHGEYAVGTPEPKIERLTEAVDV